MNKENIKYANLLYNVAVENAHYLNSTEKEDLKRQFKKLANNESQSGSNVDLSEVNEKLDKVVKAISYNASEIQQRVTYAKIDCRDDITKELLANSGTTDYYISRRYYRLYACKKGISMRNSLKIEGPVKTYLKEDELPKAWYNVRADMKKKPAPLLNPATGKPVTFEDLQPVFCDELIKQELDNDTAYIEIPEEIRTFYKMYRPSPLVRAYFLEQALGTPAHI